jgi:hypothetical protein
MGMELEWTAQWHSSLIRADDLLRSGDFNGAAGLYRSLTSVGLPEDVRFHSRATAMTAIVKNRLGLCEGLMGRQEIAESLFNDVDSLYEPHPQVAGAPASNYLKETVRHLRAERVVVFKDARQVDIVNEVSICQHGCPIPWPPPCGLEAGHCL